VSVARFIAAQRTCYRVPHAFTCRLLEVSESWFYKWRDRMPTASEQRRGKVDAAVRDAFKASRRLHGSPRLHVDLLAAG
jgi:putative transposase